MNALPVDLIRLETFFLHGDADRIRGLLQHHGVTGLVITDRPSPMHLEGCKHHGCVYDLMVPPGDAAKAIGILRREWQGQDPAKGAFREEIPSARLRTGHLPSADALEAL